MASAADSAFQARSKKEGAQAQKMAEQVLTGAGFSIAATNAKIPECGITMNFVALDKRGDEWMFDVAGAFTSPQAGLIRTDTMWKTLGRANVLHQLGLSGRLVFLTTNLPAKDSVGDRALRLASATFFDALEMLQKLAKQRLRRYAEGGPQLPLPGLLSAEEIYGSIAVEPAYGAKLAVPVARLGPIPGVKATPVELPHRLKVMLPSVTRSEQPIATSTRQNAGQQIRSMLGRFAGGCTTQEGKGSWVHPLAGVTDEDVSVIEAYSPTPFSEQLIADLVTVVLEDLDQQTAALVVNDVMYQFPADD